jgi:two-component system, response regulator PdtaR
MSDVNEAIVKPAVLVVEDEFLVRMQAVEMIEEAGFDVVEASNADEAIRLLETRKDIRIVFTDIEMPGSMDGLRLARAIRDRWPPIELILTSGKHQFDAGEIPARGHFVPKPYSFDVLVTTLSKLASQ